MRPKELIIKCYAEREEDVWVALCLDFNIAAQGDSFEEVKTKLESMIFEYVHDALEGEDKRYANQLLTRRAPFWAWARYYIKSLKIRICHSRDHIFNETMPLRPA
jgi:predicted RNase H-like HicB family nuclease